MPDERWVYPLKIDASGRYLTDQEGKRFLIHGDAGWSSIVGLTTDEAITYLTARKQQGFNAVIISLIEHYYAGGKNRYGPPFNRDGVGPFTKPGDFSKPDERYFAHADLILKKAEELGLAVFFVPCYLGLPGKTEGWYDELKVNDVENLRLYGEYVGRRYGKFKNIVWVAGGDRNPDEVRPQVLAMVEGIRKFASDRLWTGHCLHETSGAMVYGQYDWLSLNSVYSYVAIPQECLNAYNAEPIRPSFLLETHYENDWDRKNADDVRRLSWAAALSGVCGQFFGNRPVWLFDPGWEQALCSPGARYQSILYRCLRSRRWEKFVPQSDAGLLVSGLVAEGVRRSAVVTDDSRSAVIYLPTGGTVEIDFSRLRAASLRASWLDPRTGAVHDAGTFANMRVETLKTPSSDDWALFLDDVSAKLNPPGVTDITFQKEQP
ncbi:MAG: DUF4038 domain-containing protein [Nibricoccus sp.]